MAKPKDFLGDPSIYHRLSFVRGGAIVAAIQGETMLTRRQFSVAMVGGAIAGVAAQAYGAGASKGGGRSGGALVDSIEQQLAQIEAGTGGRLGVAIHDTQTGQRAGLRQEERFPMCSTFKFLLVSAMLVRKDGGHEKLERHIVFSKADLVPNSPVTEQHASGDGMSIAGLCEAALTRSDNTAANLLLSTIGGPTALTAFARSVGDRITRLDRIEPTLNEAIPGDLRDTTTPAAMLANMRRILLGERLSVLSRAQLVAWLVANKTGDTRIRAKLPRDWRVGDKTGTGECATANDIAILWPPGRAPILVTVYLTGASEGSERANAAIADVGALVAATA